MLLHLFDFLFQFAQAIQQAGQPGKSGRGSQPLAGGKGGRTGDAGAGRHVAADAALRVDNRAFAYGQVARGTNLSGEKHVAFQNRAAGEAGLGANDVVFAHGAACPTCTRISILAPRLMRVSPTVARSMEVSVWTSTSSSRTVIPDWTILKWVPSARLAKPKPSPPTTAPF